MQKLTIKGITGLYLLSWDYYPKKSITTYKNVPRIPVVSTHINVKLGQIV